MSELMNLESVEVASRKSLLATVSALVLMQSIAGIEPALAQDDTHQSVWIELGGELTRLDGANAPFTPDFIVQNEGAAVFEPISPLAAQKMPRYSFGGEGKIAFLPHGSDWSFTASVRFGRSNNGKDFQQQTAGQSVKTHFLPSREPQDYAALRHSFFEAQTEQVERHLIADFKVGKDVGLGLFGRMASHVDVGVRVAQITSKASATMHARPDMALYTRPAPPPIGTIFPSKYLAGEHFHVYTLIARNERSFTGWGPSLSWNGSVPLSAKSTEQALTLDFGIDGALLFGRQKASVEHQTSGRYFRRVYGNQQFVYLNPYSVDLAHSRAKSVTVPNLGLSAGLSYRIENFRMTLGYDAQFFFNAMDTGIDRSRSQTFGLHGPSFKIAIGLGD